MPRHDETRHAENCADERRRLAYLVEPIVANWRDDPDAAAVGLADVLTAGLESRLGLFLWPYERDLYGVLRKTGYEPSDPHPSVCDACSLVFAPIRKGEASKCAHCHHRTRPRPVGVTTDAGGSVIFNGADTRPIKIGSCAECDRAFFAVKTNQIYCSDPCRKGRRPTIPRTDVESFVTTFTGPMQNVLSHALADRSGKLGAIERNAACEACHRYYRTMDPVGGICEPCRAARPSPT